MKTCAADYCNYPPVLMGVYCSKHGPRTTMVDAPQSAADQQIVCPHCQTRGHVTTAPVKLKRGISGGKATGAVLTGGLSVLATGLSRKQAATEAKCANCQMSWTIA